MVRILLLGDSNVGKTSLLNRFLESCEVVVPTIGITFQSKLVVYKRTPYKVRFLDVSGAPHFANLLDPYLEKGDIAIIVYDVTRRSTFESCVTWYDRVKHTVDVVLLVGNKIDKASPGRQVSVGDATKFVYERPTPFSFHVELSSYNDNFKRVVRRCLAKFVQLHPPEHVEHAPCVKYNFTAFERRLPTLEKRPGGWCAII